MDATLVARELEMTLLAKVLESRYVDASSNLTMPAAALLHLMRAYLGPEIDLRDLQSAAASSQMLELTSYMREYRVADVASAQGVKLSLHHWNPLAASRSPFEALLAAHADRPRPPIAATTFRGGLLGTKPVTFEICNEGYGAGHDVQVRGIDAPDWVTTSVNGRKVTVAASPTQAGVYSGTLTVHTNANDVPVQLCTQSAAFTLLDRDELTLEELLTVHPDIDRNATITLIEAHLARLRFERLPGGVFIRRGVHVQSQRVDHWWLSTSAITGGSLPASGYPAEFTVYADEGAKTDKYAVKVTAQHGQLGGDLGELFDLLDIQDGQKLQLAPYKGGFKATFSPAEPWRTAAGHTYWLQGPLAAVIQQPDVLDSLLRLSDDKNVTVNLLLSGDGGEELPADLTRQHRAGRLTIRWTPARLPYRLIVCGEDHSMYLPPHGGLQRPATPPQALWEASAPLLGLDFREQAWQRGRGDGAGEGGLLDLELSVAMARLAEALKPASTPDTPPEISVLQREQLSSQLPRVAAELRVHVRPVLAAPHLQGLQLSAPQVNAAGNGYRVTVGGYLVARHQDIGRQREWARYLGGLYGGVIHHSQLRKLVEAFTGQSIEPTSFVTASLDVMGWAGNGYRRPRQGWEPTKRELVPFAGEVIAHLGQDAGLDWLRRNVAASEEQLSRAVGKASAALPSDASPAPARTLPDRKSKVPATNHAQGSRPPSKPNSRETSKKTPALPEVTFAPLTTLSETLPDPRTASALAVKDAVKRLVVAEGPMTEDGLIRRYAALARLNPVQVRSRTLDAAQMAEIAGDVLRRTARDHTEYLVPGQTVRLRERGARQPEDIPLSEWRLLFHSLRVKPDNSTEAEAFSVATSAFRFGNAGASVRPVIMHAWRTVAQVDHSN
ncbi:hypothetical protein [Deinococcus marmoris]|uniref:hypothetical protein n=1 Tax=Deinococcus marmoris TaxID=249408 RepID=UPI0004981408|nr:hypothetical protein [Deinococcus marmoris]